MSSSDRTLAFAWRCTLLCATILVGCGGASSGASHGSAPADLRVPAAPRTRVALSLLSVCWTKGPEVWCDTSFTEDGGAHRVPIRALGTLARCPVGSFPNPDYVPCASEAASYRWVLADGTDTEVLNDPIAVPMEHAVAFRFREGTVRCEPVPTLAWTDEDFAATDPRWGDEGSARILRSTWPGGAVPSIARAWRSSGLDWHCVETEDRRVFCEGENVSGWSAGGDLIVRAWEEIPELSHGVFAPGSRARICTVTESAIVCLGGDLRDVTPRAREVERIPFTRPVRTAAVTDDGGCLVTFDRELYCWGSLHPEDFDKWNRSGFCGPEMDVAPNGYHGFRGPAPVPVRVATDVEQVAVDNCGVCVTTSSDEVACWHEGSNGGSPDNPYWLVSPGWFRRMERPLNGR